ncbi:MAG: DNA ligase [Desulfobulbaceae bacterium]|uniref:DNA ligase n=1 Tax=Candidatus Desulfatifera sulfidica TaxID=2841691 RepID=A0A8J6NAJ7_9BACT|nr:DNA ligase [Candidatus Desulfatifera sulfidica]
MKSSFISLFLCLTFFVVSAPVHALDIMLPLVYEEQTDVRSWLMSEKLDGVRGYWDGRKMFSKNGLPFHPHPDFIKTLPPFPLEGEIWGGRQTFAKTSGMVRKKAPHEGWRTLQFAIFDAPEVPGGIEQRLLAAQEWFRANPSSYAFVIEHHPVHDAQHLQAELQRIEKLGGEGIILRRPNSPYVVGRSADILKVKSYYDTEAVVIAEFPGNGRNKDRMGSLLVELPETKIRFKIGSGFTDAERETPPVPGSVITFRYYGFYESGIPKFPSFLRIRP